MINLKFDDAAEWQNVCGDFVNKHVVANIGGLVDTLAKAHGSERFTDRNLDDLAEQAFELCRPSVNASDRREALTSDGYRVVELDDGTFVVTDVSDEDAYDTALSLSDYDLEEIEPGTWSYYPVDKPDDVGQVLAPSRFSALRAACSALDLKPDYDPIGEGDDEVEALANAFENEPDL